VASWRIVIYGALLILVMVLKPEGFITTRFVYRVERALSRRKPPISHSPPKEVA
jgi:hypothetical protein